MLFMAKKDLEETAHKHHFILIDSVHSIMGFTDYYRCEDCGKLDRIYRSKQEQMYLPTKKHFSK